MNEHFEREDYSDLKRELEALRKRMEDLESGRPSPNVAGRAARRRRLSVRPALALPLLMVAVLLALGVLGAEKNKPDALYIGPDGKVGIGTIDPKATLDIVGTLKVAGGTNAAVGINTAPISNQNLVISPTKGNVPLNVTDPTKSINWLTVFSDGRVGMNGGSVDIGGNLNLGNSSLYFTKTDHDWSYAKDREVGQAAIENSKDYNALMIVGRTNSAKTRIVGLWDRVGIGMGKNDEPKASLDVRGEIRGKPWVSAEYEWKQNPWEGGAPASWKQMTKSDRSVCFLTFVSGLFYGAGEAVGIKEEGGYWKLGGYSGQKHLYAKARCIGAPDDSW